MQKTGLLAESKSHWTWRWWGCSIARQELRNVLQLASARAIRSSKAFCWSLLCNNKTSLMSFSSKPISLNWLISWRSSVIWKRQNYLQEKQRISAQSLSDLEFSTKTVNSKRTLHRVRSHSLSTAHTSSIWRKVYSHDGHRITEWFGLDKTSGTTQFNSQLWAGMTPTVPSCPVHPAWQSSVSLCSKPLGLIFNFQHLQFWISKSSSTQVPRLSLWECAS